MKFIKEKLSAKKIFYAFSNVFLIGCTIGGLLYLSFMLFLEFDVVMYDFVNFIVPVAIYIISVILIYGILRGIYDLFDHLEAIQAALEKLTVTEESHKADPNESVTQNIDGACVSEQAKP